MNLAVKDLFDLDQDHRFQAVSTGSKRAVAGAAADLSKFILQLGETLPERRV